MNTNILVAYASKYGATKEIAEKIGQVLTASGLPVDIQAVDKVLDLTRYTGVVLGSAVYAGQWMKPAVAFLENNEATLAKLPVWFFSSGPTGAGDPVELMKGWRFPKAQQPIADRIHPQEIVSFHGDLNTSKLNIAEKLLIKGIRAPVGDYRDWSRITDWASHIAEALLKIGTTEYDADLSPH